ncbi:MAG: type II toxin-antitoxin system VapC family toxin [Thermoprotei archaeon]
MLVETSALIEYLKGDKKVSEIISNSEDFYVSYLTVYEVLIGKVNVANVLDFLSPFWVIGPTKKDALLASQIYRRLRDKGKIIDDFDVPISAQAINNELTLVTKDKDFVRVKEEFDGLDLMMI